MKNSIVLTKEDLYLTLQDVINMESYQLSKEELMQLGLSKIEDKEDYNYQVTNSELSEIVIQLIKEHY